MCLGINLDQPLEVSKKPLRFVAIYSMRRPRYNEFVVRRSGLSESIQAAKASRQVISGHPGVFEASHISRLVTASEVLDR